MDFYSEVRKEVLLKKEKVFLNLEFSFQFSKEE